MPSALKAALTMLFVRASSPNVSTSAALPNLVDRPQNPGPHAPIIHLRRLSRRDAAINPRLKSARRKRSVQLAFLVDHDYAWSMSTTAPVRDYNCILTTRIDSDRKELRYSF